MTLKPPDSGNAPDPLALQAVNVFDHGATGRGIVDEIAAFEAAREAAGAGGDIYIPVGTYLLSRPWVLLRGQRVLGSNKQVWWETGDEVGSTQTDPASRIDQPICVLKPTSDFTGVTFPNAFGGPLTVKAVIVVPGSTDLSGDTHPRWGGHVWNVGIEGNRVGTNVHGISLVGQATDWHLQDVEIANCTGNALNLASYEWSSGNFHQPQNMSVFRCSFHNNAGNGVSASSCQDSTFMLTWCHHNQGYGYFFSGSRHNELVACKAEQNKWGYGAQGSSEVIFSACRTDLNEQYGFLLQNSGSKQVIQLVGCSTHRDGRGSTGTASGFAGIGIYGVTGSTHGPVRIVGHNSTIGKLFSGDTDGPEIALDLSFAPDVYIDGTFWGRLTAIAKANSSAVRTSPNTALTTGLVGAEVSTRPWAVSDAGTFEKSVNANNKTWLRDYGAIEMYGGSFAYIEMNDTGLSDVGAPGVNTGRLFMRVTAGKTQLCVRFATGTPIVLATQA